MTDNTIEFGEVSIAYGSSVVIESFSLSVKPGEVVALFGPSGCGKSTLIKALLGMVPLNDGEIAIGGVGVASYSEPIAYLPQESELFLWLTVLDNVNLWHRESERPGRRKTAVSPDDALEMVEMGGASGKLPLELSGGMARRTALARCLSTHGRVMLLDEAFGSVERRLRRKLMIAVRDHAKKGAMTTLLVSHDLEEAVLLSDRVVCLSATPTTIERVVAIDLPSVRSANLVETDVFRQAVLELLG